MSSFRWRCSLELAMEECDKALDVCHLSTLSGFLDGLSAEDVHRTSR